MKSGTATYRLEQYASLFSLFTEMGEGGEREDEGWVLGGMTPYGNTFWRKHIYESGFGEEFRSDTDEWWAIRLGSTLMDRLG